MLTESVLELDTIFCSASQAQGPRSGRTPLAALPPIAAPSSTLSSTIVSSTASDPVPRSAKPVLTCGNCKSRDLRFTGHTDGTYFQPGGGMEGLREEYLSSKGRFHAMFVECLDSASILLDTPFLFSCVIPFSTSYS